MHFLRLLTVWWPGTQIARDNHVMVIAGNFVNIHRFQIFFHSQTQQ